MEGWMMIQAVYCDLMKLTLFGISNLLRHGSSYSGGKSPIQWTGCGGTAK